jgi:putative superfamily III holin-X
MSAKPNMAERPLAAVLSSILDNVQDIVRSEVKLVKSEAREEIGEITCGAAWLAAGLLGAFFAMSFLLGAAFFALSRIVQDWAAASIIAAALGVFSAVALSVRSSMRKRLTDRTTQQSVPHPKEGIA